MNYMKNIISQLNIFLIAAFTLLITGCSNPYPEEYSAAPLSAKIVDRETGEPVEGAIVVAVYVMESLSGRVYTPLHYEETLTDNKGKFTFHGFDKKSAPRELSGDAAVFGMRDPRLYVFADGYAPAMYQRDPVFSKLWETIHRISPLNGRTFTIIRDPVEISHKQHEQLTSSILRLSSDINSRTNPGTGKHIPCAFNKIPLALAFLQKSSIAHNNALNTSFTVPQAIECYSDGAENEE